MVTMRARRRHRRFLTPAPPPPTVAEGNTGSDVPGLMKVDVTLEADMAAFDQLGPKTRAVLNDDMGVRFSSMMTLEFARHNMKLRVQNPQHDEKLAEMLKEQNVKILSTLRIKDAKEMKDG